MTLQFFNKKLIIGDKPIANAPLSFGNLFLGICSSVQQFIESYGYPLVMQGIKTAGSLLNYKVWGNAKQDSTIINNNEIQFEKGFLPTTGAYPVSNSSFPNAEYTIVTLKAGDRIDFNSDKIGQWRIRIIDLETKTVIRGLERKETSAYKSNVSGVAGESATLPLTAGYVEAKQDVTLGFLGLSGAQTVIGEGIPMQFKITHKTPTPETLVEVQGVGVKTENLFDVTTILNYWKAGYTVQGSTITVNNLGNAYTNPYKLVDTPTTLYLSCSIKDITSTNARVALGLLQDDGTFITKASYNADTTGILTQTNVNAVRLDWSKGNTFTITDLIITTDSATTSYEPYGYKIPVTASGKNLFDIQYFANNYQSYQDSKVGRLPLKLLPLTEYTVQTNDGSSGSATVFVVSGTDIAFTPSTSLNGITPDRPRTVTTDNDGYLTIGIYKDERLQPFLNGTSYVQLELGSTPTAYEPYHAPVTTNIYLDKPLYKIGNYADYVDFEKQQVVRNVINYTFTGNESWQTGATYKYSYKAESYIGSNIQTGIGYMTNQKISATQSEATSDSNTLHPKYTKEENITRLYTNLNTDTTKLANGVAYFARITPTTETITLPQLPVFEGTTIYTVDGLEPSDMYGKK